MRVGGIWQMTLEGGMKLTSRPRVVGIYFYSQFLLGGKLNLPFLVCFVCRIKLCKYVLTQYQI